MTKPFPVNLKAFLHDSRLEHLDSAKADKDVRKQYHKELDETGFVDQHVVSAIGNISGQAILDVGSGSGWQAVAIAIRGAKTHGVEPDLGGVNASIERARRYPGISAEFRQGSAEHIPYDSNMFDAVISFHTIEHVQEVDKALKEMYRVLRPGGRLYIETTNSLLPREEHYRIFWIPGLPKPLAKVYVRLLGKNPQLLDVIHYMFKWALRARLRRAGFQNINDKYEAYVVDKFSHPEKIQNKPLRWIMHQLCLLHLANPCGRLIAVLGVYPSLWMVAEK